MKLDVTHDMYMPDPPRRKNRPTPARDRADRPGITPDPNGTREQREAYVRSRQLREDAAPAAKGKTLIDALVQKHFEEKGWRTPK